MSAALSHSTAVSHPSAIPQVTVQSTVDPAEEVAAAVDLIFEAILGFLLPIFLTTAGGDPVAARSAVLELIDAYGVTTVRQLILVGRIMALSTAAMDDLRRSMVDPAMPDAKVLRLRNNAVALNRTADRCQKALEMLQAPQRPATRPAAVAAQRPAVPPPAAVWPAAQPATATEPKPDVTNGAGGAEADVATMRQEVGAILAAAERAPASAGSTAGKAMMTRSTEAVAPVANLQGARPVGVELDRATKDPMAHTGIGR
jgi:hypothetical protein